MERQRHIFTLSLALVALALCLVATAARANTNLHDAGGTLTSLLDLVKANAAHWDAKLKGYAKTLFWLLATIQFVWAFFPLVFRQSDFGEIVGELIRFILITGFFYALLLFSADWAGAVVDSFRQAGANAAGLGIKDIRPGDIFGTAVDLANTVGNVETWNPLSGIMIALSALVVLVCFAFIAAFMGLTIIESYVVINASALFMGFGASQWTREYALAIVRYAVSVGAKLFILTLIVGLIVDSAKQWSAAYTATSTTDDASMWTMVGLSLTCAYLAKTIPELVAGMISGTSMGGGSSIGGMAAAGAAGATAAIATLATAGAAAPAAAAALGATGGGGAASGLAGAINASFAGGSGAAGAASATSSGMGSAGLGTGTGGSMAAKSAGARIGGSASSSPTGASASSPSPSVRQAAGQADKAQDRKVTGHQVASGLTRGAGIISAISVPGMESAAGLSLASGAPQPVPGTDGANTHSSMEMEGSEPQNIIRPVDAPSQPNVPTSPASTSDTKKEDL
ncbi:P-type conjugative transfer protein TrbL [Xenorhabdus bovienii]|uniref:P-type conjugative transfer protein TrbL n=1 Tax=Xenorhabdus bovienii TaxID=40576 RepID=UPI0023B23580|nr:P-type conjugative transfer protein TrbL [Xenorhabdus bovienii]MDE9463071.1 P-type conjugative transfer protein TrbL [Xenorhabdus bovienii]